MKNLIALWLVLFSVCSLRGQTNDPILSEVSVLTIHVSDTNTHDAVFHFLTDVLRLPCKGSNRRLVQVGTPPSVRENIMSS